MGLDQQHSRFLESLSVLISVPVSQRSFGPRVGYPRPANLTRQARRTTPQVGDAQEPQRHLLPLEERLPVAHAPARVPALVYRAPLLQGVAHRRHLGEGQRDLARKDAHKRRSRSPTERRDPRYPIGEDYQRWGRTRI